MYMNSILNRIDAFCRDEEANISLEACLIFPLLIWAYVSAFVFFDAYRVKNTNLKAAYTISDMLSRQTDFVDQPYLDGLNEMFDILASSPHPTWIRVSVITWDGTDDEYQVVWSESTKSQTTYPDGLLDEDVAQKIPELSDGDTIILVETNMVYEPLFRMAMEQTIFENFVVTSPRFAPLLCWEGPCTI